MPVWQDGFRTPDDQNPHGYYELERVKELDKNIDKVWMRDGSGRAIKIISSLLEHLPRTNNYRVGFMLRDLHEVLASQASMLTMRGLSSEFGIDDTLLYEAHLRKVNCLLTADPAFSFLHVEYADVLSDPRKAADDVDRFVGGHLDVMRMTAAVDWCLYRHRAGNRRTD